jgi:methylase of polypeptide subunit release factors
VLTAAPEIVGAAHAAELHASPTPVTPVTPVGIAALATLLREVAASGYRFTTSTPLTHQRILTRRSRETALCWRDAFGWNLPFPRSILTPSLAAAMQAAGVLQPAGALLRSAVRIASLDNDLFLHSAYPTTSDDAVFFGPDTYRFARLIGQNVSPGASGAPCLRLLDIGCGSGAGAIAAVRALAPHGRHGTCDVEVVMNDINPLALRYAAINAALAGIPVVLAEGDALAAVDGLFDLILSNPPYMDDSAQRAYRHGGARLGRALSVRIVAESLPRLARGGKLVLYTGVAIVDGADPFLAEVLPLLAAADCDWHYEEIDPDVFGEELERPQYAHVDRIAAVGLVVTRRGGR